MGTQRAVASFFGSGLLLRRLRGSDDGSGTVGSLLAFGLTLLVGRAGWIAQAAFLAVVLALAYWSIGPFLAEGDPGWIVIDEAAGVILATMGLAPVPAVVALAVFRVADITKRFPGVAQAERLSGATGIVADDLVAGLYGLAAGWLTAFWVA
ncbi:MAG TPA: phosphatidylglycerophosphatase A [Acidimicrobiia bacterium]|jgi:phosphatidylglycerophosphatase A